MKYYIIAGEASGDLHGSNLMKELNLLDPNADFRYWGGDLMQAQSGVLVKHYKDLAFMGFLEVVANLSTIIKNLKFCKDDILKYKPDVVILIDYPGFNLRIANFLKTQNIKVIYYISPQVWAWKQSRVHQIKKVVNKMLVILPFEKVFYKKFDYEVDFVGHPLLDAIDQYHSKEKQPIIESNGKPILALLPGSRKQEIDSMLPVMLEAANSFSEYHKIIAAAPGQSIEYYKSFISGLNDVSIIKGKTYEILMQSRAAFVTSGTATLETALMGVPEIVCYKGNAISYQIAKRLVKVDYISLVNLIMNREVVKELIQEEFNTEKLRAEFIKLMSPENLAKLQEAYKTLKMELGGKGASKNAAVLITNYLAKPN